MLQDWKGNPVRNGDEFCIVRISPNYRLQFNGMMWLHGNWEGKIIPCSQYWEPGPYYKVSHDHFTFMKDETSITVAICSLSRDSYKDNRYIIAIKGLSDKKEDYYGNNNKV